MHARLDVLAQSVLTDDSLAVIVTSQDGSVRYLNAVAEGMLGVSQLEAQNDGWNACLPGAASEAVQDLQATIMRGTYQDARVTVECRQGALLLVTAKAIRDGDQVLGVIWEFERCASEVNTPLAAMPPHLKRYQKLFESSVIAMWVVDIKPLYRLLERYGLRQKEALTAYLESHPTFWEQIRTQVRVADANQAAAELFSAASPLAWRQTMAQFLRRSDLLMLCYTALAVDKGAQRISHQSELLTFEGEAKHLWMAAEVPDADNIDLGVLVCAIDISAMKDAERELEEREQFLETILRTVPDLLFVYDCENHNLIYENEDFRRYLGYDEQQVQETNPEAFLKYVLHPDDQIIGKTMKLLRTELQQGQIFESSKRLQGADGEWRHFAFRSAALEYAEDGSASLAVVVARDITDMLKTQQSLVEQERRYRLLADNFTDVIITTDSALKLEYISPSVQQLLGLKPEQFALQHGDQVLAALGLESFEAEIRQAYDDALRKKPTAIEDYQCVVEVELRHQDQYQVPVELKISLLRGQHGELQGVMILCRDITERRKVQADLHLAAKVFENSLEGIYITDAEGYIAQINKTFIETTGYNVHEAVGQRPAFLSSGWHGQFFATEIRPALEKTGYWQGELINRRKSGEVFPAWVGITEVRDKAQQLLGYITSFRDITETKNNQERIRKLAYFDPLTELPNRSLFHDRLSQTLQRAQRNNGHFVLLFLDLDRFKAINDSMGHEVGDQLLKEASQRLSLCIRSDDTVARMGGDEFTLILSGLADREAAEAAAVQVSIKIMNALNKPFFLEGSELYISTSIGIAIYPFDGREDSVLLRNADTAMYHAKRLGKNGYQFYTEAMNERSLERLEFQNSLHRAVLEEEFELAFQPIYNLQDQVMVGVEALLRWRHPEKGLIEPEDFLAIAKENGLIVKIGEWAIRAACKQMATWLSMGCRLSRIAVNVSALQFNDGNLVRSIIDAIDESGISPGQLELEVTETMLMEDFHFSCSMLQDLKALGVRISVDDFGTGASSLSYLKRLPLDCLKIDQSFVANLHQSSDDRRIAQAVIGLAKSFGLGVVAEGVEGPEQATWLLDMGCDEGQGYLLGKPQNVQQMTGLLLAMV